MGKNRGGLGQKAGGLQGRIEGIMSIPRGGVLRDEMAIGALSLYQEFISPMNGVEVGEGAPIIKLFLGQG